ncbi:hypothetical protein B7463_g8715, partial [Scytalidium lignicola]
MAAPESPLVPNTSATKNGTLSHRRKPSGRGQVMGARDTPLNRQKSISKRRKSPSLSRRCKRFAVRHTWTIPLLLLLVFFSLYSLNPTESNIIHHFIFPSYKEQSRTEIGTDASKPPQYGKGLWDIAFVSFYTIVLSFTREFIMQELLLPLARFSGIKSHSKQSRFAEQMYTAIYFGLMGPAGLYVMRQTPVWYFNTSGMYEFFPHRTHQAEFKFYYLFQAAYWTQQAIVMLLGMEKPRKDYRELVAHHIVTVSLIALSYRFHFTYMGIAVYVTHDISDFFLAVSKSLHYLDSILVAPLFALNIGVWIYLRHYQNLRIILSLFNEFQTVGSYELNWETQQYKCWISNIITFGLLAALQTLNIFWLYCLLRSMYRYLRYNVKKDDRSEDESEPEETEREKEAEKTKKTNVAALVERQWNRRYSANGVMKATGNGTAAPPMKWESAQ